MKKTTANNRRKKLPLLLGALLIISVAAYGTRAYFSDSATVQGDIQLSLGNVDIKSVDSHWKYITNDEDVNSALLAGTTRVTSINGTTGVKSINREILITDSQNITNVQPGDQFERIFEFENSGSLEQVVTVENKVLSNTASIFEVDFKQLDKDGNKLTNVEPANIISGGSVKYKMTISVKTTDGFNATHNINNGTQITEETKKKTIFDAIGSSPSNDDVTEEYLKNAVTVTANQVNAPSN